MHKVIAAHIYASFSHNRMHIVPRTPTQSAAYLSAGRRKHPKPNLRCHHGQDAPGKRAECPSCYIKHLVSACAVGLCVLAGHPASAEEATAASFKKNCIGCHVGGGNVVQAGKSLRHPDLERNGAGSVAEIYDLLYNGKGKMPGYGTGCMPRGKCTFGPRLSDDEIQQLSAYVLDQADAGWK